ncbi:P-loop containing nucleoside triphosphate hydrolase protein [Favolaschia claudopus]|uniref:P-loop containing nucleoside triphosphate hydrolase protein n=1 Tax=Favolaschia claudopus TaxID=2862362 RepID=A0AAW0B5A6_9AGAR
MPRPSSPAVDASYDSDERSSTYSDAKASPVDEQTTTNPAPSVHTPPVPSIRLLFSQVSPRHRALLLTPAIISSLVAGAIAPFMTLVIGQAFDAFAKFPLTPNPPQSAKDSLIHSMAIAAFELIGLAVGSVALSSVMSCLWIWTGEHNVMVLRKRVYAAVTRKDMVWFDTKMGAEGTIQSAEEEHGPLGAGGLMAKFARETDEVREASSLAAGRLVQYMTTCLTCLALGFMRSWALTLVILSAVPILIVIQTLSQIFAGPLLNVERATTATAATHVDRAVTSISTVKAFNAEAYEQTNLGVALDRMSSATKRLNAVWGLTSGLAQFVMMGMFVQGFWFGSKLVRDGTINPGDVMAVFWACLIATSNLQMCIPQFIVLAKGKFSMVSLLTLIDDDDDNHGDSSVTPSPSAHSLRKRSNRILRKIRPVRCAGEFALHNITFAYPSRPTVPVLQDVSLFLPAYETTFIVGSSGSGKSTIAHLLLGLYAPQAGAIQLDDQDVRFMDETWRRTHVAGIEQGCILFDMSVFDNVALGAAGGRPVTREEVKEACVSALMHEFVRDLPDGYDTMLGTNGASLSGGQKQRLAIARARLRDPTVLILDEATSALDPTSRILVFEAIKRWRKNKTTIVITHDLSQISSSDFVYVLKNGVVAEQGYRYDLETAAGEFSAMMLAQHVTGGFLPVKEFDDLAPPETSAHHRRTYTPIPEEDEGSKQSLDFRPSFDSRSHASIALTTTTAFGHWMFDVVADLTAPQSAVVRTDDAAVSRPSLHIDTGVDVAPGQETPRPRRPSSVYEPPVPPSPAVTVSTRRFSLQFTPTSTVFSFNSSAPLVDDEKEIDEKTLERNGTRASSRRRRPSAPRVRTRWDDAKLQPMPDVKVELPSDPEQGPPSLQQLSVWALVRVLYPTVPYKPLVLLGVIVCLISGAMTPIFSFLLSRLFYGVATGAHDIATINKYGFIVLSTAALDGIFIGLKYFIMESTSMSWITRVRKACFQRVLAQDKKWFDKQENAPPRVVQVLIKDGDDARNLIAVVLSQLAVVTSMLGVGLIWALVKGWQLTLVGFAIAPVFAVTMVVQAGLVAKCELRNKRAREEVSQGYYEAISNVRGIRSMGFETIFQKQFDAASDRALSTGVKGAFVEGCTYGVASGLIYLAEALLFYVGAVLVAHGTYSYLQMVQVMNLVVFTVTIGSQLMAFTQKIAKSVQATRDFNELLALSTKTDESAGIMCPPLDGPITFQNIQFAYPERADVPVLKNLNLEIDDGECVAIVGASGSGKSTVTSLLQRLYEPQGGKIFIGLHELRLTNVNHLRHNVSVVSQNPNLFDATITENISYGNADLTFEDVRRAAQAASVHDFIMSLPQGYDTMVGENAALISGGQAQRLSIARALVRPSKVLILDECTSALDPANQAVVLETIRHAKVGRTTIMVTHKLPVMQMCDRILVMQDGRIAEHGSYDQLMQRKGLFAQLASGGEWE